ncbi:MAG: Heme-degrading monooxygenase HmoA [Chloroflexi bacterium]|jgi:heme-degrading monooxygenase HmoA|nr:MAG: Heme-degrading monooxygenase HmoA [Chloroflexota bacterium]
MIGVLTHHWAEQGKVENAIHILNGNGEAQSKAPGFINRTTLLSKTDPTQISSLVVWESDHIYDEWKESAERAKAMKNAEDLWSRTPESERFDIP